MHIRASAISPGAMIVLFLVCPGIVARSAQGQELAGEKAKAFFQHGVEKYRLGHFQEALTDFTEALQLDKRPSIILNLAQCFRQLGQNEKAIFYYKLYLDEWQRQNPGRESPYYHEVQQFLSRLQQEIDKAPKARPQLEGERPEQKPREKSAEKNKKEQDPQRILLPSVVRPPHPGPPLTQASSSRTKPIYRKWWFWTTISAVIIGGTAAAIAATTGGSDWVPTSQLPSNRYTPQTFGD